MFSAGRWRNSHGAIERRSQYHTFPLISRILKRRINITQAFILTCPSARSTTDSTWTYPCAGNLKFRLHHGRNQTLPWSWSALYFVSQDRISFLEPMIMINSFIPELQLNFRIFVNCYQYCLKDFGMRIV